MNDADVKNFYTRLPLPFHSFDGDTVTYLHFFSESVLIWLVFFLPTKHPVATTDKFLILVIYAAPRSANNPIAHEIFLVNVKMLNALVNRCQSRRHGQC